MNSTRQTPALNRRQFLHGSGVALGVPLLESAMPRPARGASAVRPPVRAAFLHFGNGVWEEAWVPKDIGKNYTLSPSLEPLAPVRNEVLVLTGLDKQHSRNGDGHYSKTANFLTGLPVKKTTGKDLSAGGISVDQLMAKHLRGATPLPSLVLSAHRVYTGVDPSVGYTRAYSSFISWESATRPVTPDDSPQRVYERLFGHSRRMEPAAARPLHNLLDFVLDDAHRLRKRLSRDDQHKMDEYLESVREVENRLQFAQRKPSDVFTPLVSPQKIEEARPQPTGDFRNHIQLMLDLLLLAFQTDSTRVCSLMMASGWSTQSFSFLEGVQGDHHELSHHENRPEKIAQYQKINRWYVEQFVGFVARLQAIPEGEGTLLDHCMIMLGSGMSDGNRHDPDNLPILLAGRGGGSIESGQHLAFNRGSTPLCNLYVAMLQRMGINVKKFGDSTDVLT